MENGNGVEEINRPWARDSLELVEKLEASSGRDLYLVWKTQVRSILQLEGLWHVVDPDPNVDILGVSLNGGPNRITLGWMRDARDLIQFAVAFEMECNGDPRECWMYLQKKFAPNNAVQRYSFLRRLWHLKMLDGESADKFRTLVQYLLLHLRDMGVVIEEKVIILLLIDALPRQWCRAAAAYRDEAQSRRTIQTTEDLFDAMIRSEQHSGIISIASGLHPGYEYVPQSEV